MFIALGMPGIEPGSHEPESCILPLYYIPSSLKLRRASLLSLQYHSINIWFIKYLSPSRIIKPEVILTTVLTLLAPEDIQRLRRILDKGLFTIVEAADTLSFREMIESLTEESVVLCDEGNSWKEILEACKQKYVPKIVLCTRRAGVSYNELWATALHHGAYDLFQLPFNEEVVVRSMRLASFPQPRKTRTAH